MIDTLASTALARLVAVRLAERVPGGPPPGIHDPALLVDRAVLRRECARHGVRLRLRGIRPSLVDLARWLAGRTDVVRMVPVPTTAVLFQAAGRREPTRRGVADRWPTAPTSRVWASPCPGRAVRQEDLWSARFAGHFAGDRAAERIFLGAGVRRRHAAVNPVAEDASGWSTGARMRRYRTEALPLGKEAVDAALADAGLRAEDIGLFAVVSCTGYATPGLDIRIAADLGMSPGLQRLVVGHMGCYAAVPGLGAVTDYVVSRRRPAVLLCCELTSLHVQPPTDDRAQVVAHALFGDAAAAVVVLPEAPAGRPALRMVDVVALTDASTADHMTWDVTDHGFRMGLSPEVPNVLARQVRGLVSELLARHGVDDRRRRRVGRASRRPAHPRHRGPAPRPAARRRRRLPGGARRVRQLLVDDRAARPRRAAQGGTPGPGTAGGRAGLRAGADPVRRAAADRVRCR